MSYTDHRFPTTASSGTLQISLRLLSEICGAIASTPVKGLHWRLMTEPGFEHYAVSDCNEVMTLTDSRAHPAGYVLQQYLFNGHPAVTLFGTNITENVRADCLVYQAFHGSERPDDQVRPLDATTTNNAVENLAWGTRADNAADIKLHGRKRINERTHLSSTEVLEMDRRRDAGATTTQIAQHFGVSCSRVSAILHGRSHAKLKVMYEWGKSD